jgi:hypothetical protein
LLAGHSTACSSSARCCCTADCRSLPGSMCRDSTTQVGSQMRPTCCRAGSRSRSSKESRHSPASTSSRSRVRSRCKSESCCRTSPHRTGRRQDSEDLEPYKGWPCSCPTAGRRIPACTASNGSNAPCTSSAAQQPPRASAQARGRRRPRQPPRASAVPPDQYAPARSCPPAFRTPAGEAIPFGKAVASGAG